MGFHYDGQVGLELLTSGDPPASASRSAGITGVSHCAQPNLDFKVRIMVLFSPSMAWIYELCKSSTGPEQEAVGGFQHPQAKEEVGRIIGNNTCASY